ncbi:DNA-binding transcriptional regulator, GntR family [Paracoccus isoporae]|uniref:DNA-binding transcriptional regulator, GntR family n=1 Tax=Paracoccus isoporae TaxID=591205 RepID=A0A1G6WGN9_9RHOB|nr:GntR family transcriptional regulator [Paracoccus isoporae]SDD64246.1 DNA-binding transcriptional regulator, GntR family [Paracoccus isoporae]
MVAQPELDFAVSTAQQVYRWLREEILRGNLIPGARLSESEISGRIGVSRQPVREAFIRLAADGLAEIRPQRGTYISRISVSAVMCARFIREAVESDLSRKVAARADAEMVRRFEAEIAAQRRALSREDAVEFVNLDDRFHRLLAVEAGEDAVWSVLEGLKSQMNRLRHITVKAFDAHKLIDQHEAIVDALRAGDADAAEAAMRRHLCEVLHDLPEIQKRAPDLFCP